MDLLLITSGLYMDGAAESEHREGRTAGLCCWWHLQWRPLASAEHSAMVAMGTAVLGQGWLEELQELGCRLLPSVFQ